MHTVLMWTLLAAWFVTVCGIVIGLCWPWIEAAPETDGGSVRALTPDERRDNADAITRHTAAGREPVIERGPDGTEWLLFRSPR